MYLTNQERYTDVFVLRQYVCKRDSVLSTQSFAYLIHASARVCITRPTLGPYRTVDTLTQQRRKQRKWKKWNDYSKEIEKTWGIEEVRWNAKHVNPTLLRNSQEFCSFVKKKLTVDFEVNFSQNEPRFFMF